MFARLSSRVYSSEKQKAICDTDTKLEELAAQSESTEEPLADEAHSNSESSGTCSRESLAEFRAAASEGPICEDELSEQGKGRMEERAGNGDPCMEIAFPNATEDDAGVVRGSPV